MIPHDMLMIVLASSEKPPVVDQTLTYITTLAITLQNT
jgi:hypothetical protein